MADWISVYLRNIGAPDSGANRQFLASWQRWEGGHTNNSARFNYLNTTQKMPGSRSMNSVGVQRYGSLSQGARAFAKTLRNGRYSGLLAGLRAGNPRSQESVKGLSTWLSGGVTPAGMEYASKVLGTKVDAPRSSTPAPQGSPGVEITTPNAPDLAGVAMENLSRMSAQKGHFDPLEGLSNLVTAISEAGSTTTHVPGQPQPQAPASEGPWQQYVRLAKGADRGGVSTQAPVKQFFGRLGASLGRPITITTGTQHNRLTVNGNVSAHWSGLAGDAAMSGAALTRAGRQALILAGMDPKQARKVKGGLFNLGGYQIIFNTREGGNHWNHLHVGIRR